MKMEKCIYNGRVLYAYQVLQNFDFEKEIRSCHALTCCDCGAPVFFKHGKKRAEAVKLDGDGILLEDVLFSSPSYAAMFVVGKSANGLTSWKTKDGRTLKSLESEEAEN